MNEIKTPLFVMLDSSLHNKLKAYAALSNESMRTVIEEWIKTLAFK